MQEETASHPPLTRRAMIAGSALLASLTATEALAQEPQKASRGNKEDEAAILTLLQRMAEGWNRGDGAAFAAVFDEDADYIVFNGAHLKGRKEIAAAHQTLFDTVLKGSKLGGGEGEKGKTGNTVRFLTPDVALIHSTGGVLRQGQEKVTPQQHSIQTCVAVKRVGKWSLAAFQNTRIQAAPAPNGQPPQQ